MTAGGNACWCGLPWQQEVAPKEYRAGVSAASRHPASPQTRGRLPGSSCMHGNVPVQFLGEEVAATPPPYPTVRHEAVGVAVRRPSG